MTGWDVAQSFHAAHPKSLIIYASGSSADDSKGVKESTFFSKPYDLALLINACRKTKG